MQNKKKVYRTDELYLGDRIEIDEDTILIGKKTFCPECKLCIGMQIKKDDNGYPHPPEHVEGCPYDKFRDA